MFSLTQCVRKTLSQKLLSEFKQTSSLFHTSPLLLTKSPDVLAVEELERNLFESSSHNSSRVSTRDLLKQYNKPSNHGRERKFRKRTPAQPMVSTGSADTASVKSNPETKFQQKTAPNVTTKPELIIDEEIGFRYTKLQRNDLQFQQMMLLVKSKKHRSIKHQLLLEGRRLIVDAIKCGFPLKYLFFSDIDQLKQVSDLAPKDVNCFKVPYSDLSFWSTLTTSPGLMAIVEKPVDMSGIWKEKNHLPIVVVCDQVREPNNVGSIIRACAAVPVEKVILTKGCADPWDTKALRGGAGAQFVVPVLGPMHWESIWSMLPHSYNVYLAENSKENYEKMVSPDGHALNNNFIPYTDLALGENCVVIIGGETEGVSKEAYELLNANRNGSCIHIPLANGVDSLNTSTALAILLFEIKKQMKEKLQQTLNRTSGG